MAQCSEMETQSHCKQRMSQPAILGVSVMGWTCHSTHSLICLQLAFF